LLLQLDTWQKEKGKKWGGKKREKKINNKGIVGVTHAHTGGETDPL
jgi:hypothetical protein